MAKVDEAFSYLRSQSEGPNDNAREGRNVNSRRSAESTSRVTSKKNSSDRNERAGSITIHDAVLDSSKDYEDLEPVEQRGSPLETNSKQYDKKFLILAFKQYKYFIYLFVYVKQDFFHLLEPWMIRMVKSTLRIGV